LLLLVVFVNPETRLFKTQHHSIPRVRDRDRHEDKVDIHPERFHVAEGRITFQGREAFPWNRFSCGGAGCYVDIIRGLRVHP
jgi:hypothetical protein